MTADTAEGISLLGANVVWSVTIVAIGALLVLKSSRRVTRTAYVVGGMTLTVVAVMTSPLGTAVMTAAGAWIVVVWARRSRAKVADGAARHCAVAASGLAVLAVLASLVAAWVHVRSWLAAGYSIQHVLDVPARMGEVDQATLMLMSVASALGLMGSLLWLVVIPVREFMSEPDSDGPERDPSAVADMGRLRASLDRLLTAYVVVAAIYGVFALLAVVVAADLLVIRADLAVALEAGLVFGLGLITVLPIGLIISLAIAARGRSTWATVRCWLRRDR